MRKLMWAAAAALVALGLLTVWRQFLPSAHSPADSGKATAGQAASPRSDHQPETTITFVGDILLAARVGRLASEEGTEHLFAGVSDLLRADDLTIGNLECPAATDGAPEDKQYTFRAHPSVLLGLPRCGIDAVSLANNHSLDYGPAALLETLAHLRKAGIAAVGAGSDLSQASRPAILSAGGQTVALVAASRVLPSAGWHAGNNRPGIAPAYNPARMLSEIRAVRPRVDVVTVYLHWGKERAIRPEPYQRALARQCIEAGADVVVGAHPHVVQGFEWYRGKLTAYSLGNFVFTGRSNTAMLQTTFGNGALRAARIVPCRIVHCRPQVINDPSARRHVLRALRERSFDVRIAEDGSLVLP